MKITGTEIYLSLDGEEIFLVPRLRCAMSIAARTGSLRGMVRDLLDQSITAAIDCIEPHCDLSREYLAELLIASDLSRVQFALLDYVMQCGAIDPEAEHRTTPKAAQQSEDQSYADFYLQLFRYGTGWLGWTPEQTLDATPFEIIEAHKGRMDMLRAIFGGGEKQTVKDDRPLDDKFRSVFAALGTQKAA